MADQRFSRGSPYDVLHRIAKELEPSIGNKGENFLAAVLQHDKDAISENFFWFMVKPKSTIAKLKKGYSSRCGEQVTLKHGGTSIPDATQIHELDHFNDNIIVFTAHRESMPPTTPSFTGMNSQTRTPLQALNSQSHNLPSAIEPEVKAEKGHLSPNPVANVNSEDTRSGGGISLASQGFGRYANENSEFVGLSSAPVTVKREEAIEDTPMDDGFPDPPNTSVLVKPEKTEDPPMDNEAASDIPPVLQTNRLQKVIEEGSPERLEAEVKVYKQFLDTVRAPLSAKAAESRDANYFLNQIETLRSESVDTPTIIGVVGRTGAGKSSVINALLEEEKLVPTNCMRACTAVVTEMSWNSSEEESSRYRAKIEFIKASDWEKDLRVSLADLMDPSGYVSKDCSNAETEAGIAYAKIKAVYPNLTKDSLLACTVEQLMGEPEVRAVLGTVKDIEKPRPELFYRALQHFIDSKEKATADSNKKKKEKGEKKQMEFWPLIKVVRIYVKADALSTGAVIVDLPGVHDSNAARAAVAAGYMKNCTGLWIVAPINRAVDDKAAKSLLGESFKRQLKYDGTYSRITFICSKTDDISITEAADSLGLEDDMREDWEKIDDIDDKKKALKDSVKELKDSKAVYGGILTDAEDSLEIWEKMQEDLEGGKEVFAPSISGKKRKRSTEPASKSKQRKKTTVSRNVIDDDDEDEDFIDDAEENNEGSESSDDDGSSEKESIDEEPDETPLNLDQITEKINHLKDDKKRARNERAEIDSKLKAANKEILALQKRQDKIEADMIALCISGRNGYSKGAIQLDFASGVKELDQENAQGEDEENFDPDDDIRDYDEVARSLPVFCCSSKAYQKMSGRLVRDAEVPGFRTPEETEIPQLQQHCKKLTEGVRASNCRRFLTNISQMLNSLNIWASNDGTGLNVSDAQRAAEARFIKGRLQTLEKSLDGAVKDCLAEMNMSLSENIFEEFPDIVAESISKAKPTVASWGAPINRQNPQLGGFFWGTYKALMRRDGVFTNGSRGALDLNLQLATPIIVKLASHWEKVFQRRLPNVLQSFSRKSKTLLIAFHKDLEERCIKNGTGARLGMLSQQLRNYEAMFVELAQQMSEFINHHQKDANREFTPAIATKLSEAYETCAAEHGSGMFARMKAQMNDHVSSNLNMFEESVNEVKKRLVTMTEQIQEAMGNKSDEVFLLMSRDYLEVLTGSKIEGATMPKWERQMRAEVAKLIEDRERANAEADAAEERAKLDTPDTNASAAEPSEGASSGEQRANLETSDDIVATGTTGHDTSDDLAQPPTGEPDEMAVDAPMQASTVSEESIST